MKAQVRKDTDDFLNNSPASTAYRPIISQDFPVISTGVELSDTLRQAADTSLDADLTGAIDPILPMYISIASAYGQRIRIMMLINPETMNHGKTNATTFAYTRKGFVTQLWGANQDILTSTGKTAAFMVPGVGITNFFRRRSFAFLNFMALMNAYRNNGYRLLDPTKTSVFTRVASLVQGVEIDYDGQTFMGHFNTFTLDEDGEHPYLLNYNFEFIISCLNNEYKEVRGHFQRIPGKDGEGAPVTLEEGATQETSFKTGNTVKLVGDIGKYGAMTPVEPLIETPRGQQWIMDLWESQTGLTFDKAIELSYTDNSVQQNERLGNVLLIHHSRNTSITGNK